MRIERPKTGLLFIFMINSAIRSEIGRPKAPKETHFGRDKSPDCPDPGNLADSGK
jgi:hypothetical protein